MNLLARILSHGFALAVVVLIAITLMYRGDLFTEWDLPEFLVIEDKSSPGTEVPETTVDSTSPEITISSPAATVSVTPEAPPVDVAPDVDTVDTNEVLSPATMRDAAGDTGGLQEEPVVTVPDDSQETGAAVATDITRSVADESDATGNRVTGDTDQADEAPSAPVTESEAMSEQPESPVVNMAPPAPATESVNEPAAEQESAEEETPVVPVVSVEASEMVTEQTESPAADMAMSTPDTEPVTEPGSESLIVEAPVVPSATGTESDAVTEQPELLTTDMTPPAPVTEAITESKREPEPETATAVSVIETVAEDEVVADQAEVASPDTMPPAPAADPVTESESESEMEPTVAEAPAATVASDDGKSAYESLAAAREAYWLHDYEGAESHYRRLIQLESDNPDWYGELGNMYFAQGQWEQAATAYYEAGVRLLKDGLMVQARQMVNVIRGLNGDGADDLEAQINNVDQVSR